MEPSFWQERWQKNEIGFHLPCVHPLLEKYLPVLQLEEGSTLFLPLCGRTLDIGYLRSLEHRVVGVELSELAVKGVFEQLGVTPEVRPWRGGRCWQADGVTIFHGDFFQLQAGDLGAVDAIYDRAALVALPPDMRERYAAHLLEITYAAPQLLISFEYDQSRMNGPPFSVPTEEIAGLYAEFYQLSDCSREDVIAKAPRFSEQGLASFVEVAWHLQPEVARPDTAS